MNLFIICGALGAGEIALIVGALLLMFGGTKIPELMKGLGKGIKEFKNASKDDDDPTKEKDKDKIEK